MPAPRLHENTIADKIVDLIKTNLAATMNLKVCSVGALELFPGLPNLADSLPAVMVQPDPNTSLRRITTAETYEITYNFRIVFVRGFGDDEEPVALKVADTQKIAELLIDNVDLGGLTLTGGCVSRTLVASIEWRPPEDLLVAQLNARATATAISFVVMTVARK